QVSQLATAEGREDVRLGENRAIRDGAGVPASKTESKPVLHRITNCVAVWRNRDAVVLVAEHFTELGFRGRLGPGACSPLLALSGRSEAGVDGDNPALATLVPVQTAIAATTPPGHQPPPSPAGRCTPGWPMPGPDASGPRKLSAAVPSGSARR